jgi:predicted heme/steroid binding protein
MLRAPSQIAPTNFPTLSYPAGSDSQNGEVPTNNDICNGGVWGFSQPIMWEGTTQTCGFDTGDVVTTNIESNAQQLANYAWVGTVSNQYKTFNCYKDSGRQLYYVNDVGGQVSCDSIYWCNPVS